MEYIAEIRAKADSNPLRLDEWMAYIASVADFRAIPGRPGINPANGEPITLRPSANAIRYIVLDSEVGAFSWGTDDQHCILVGHVPEYREVVLARAKRIADALNADLVQWDLTPPA